MGKVASSEQGAIAAPHHIWSPAADSDSKTTGSKNSKGVPERWRLYRVIKDTRS